MRDEVRDVVKRVFRYGVPLQELLLLCSEANATVVQQPMHLPPRKAVLNVVGREAAVGRDDRDGGKNEYKSHHVIHALRVPEGALVERVLDHIALGATIVDEL